MPEKNWRIVLSGALLVDYVPAGGIVGPSMCYVQGLKPNPFQKSTSSPVGFQDGW